MSWLDPTAAQPANNPDPYLRDTVRRLWPAPARLEAPGRWTRASGRSYLVVPSADRPKVLVPQRPRRVSAGAIRGFKSTQNVRETLVLGGLALALRAGLGALLPDRLHVSATDGTDLETELARILGRSVHLSLHVSAPRAVRKPVLQLLDDAGRTFAFAKLGIDAFTDTLVRAEASAVGRLGSRPMRTLRVPSVLHAGDWRGHALLVQGAAPRGRGAEQAPELVAAAMDELARATGAERSTLAASRFWTQLEARTDALAASRHRDAIRASMAVLAARRASAGIEVGAWHGDWTPWNMNVSGAAVHVWDWEKFETGVPIGLDAIHFDIQRAVVRQAQSPKQAFGSALVRADTIVAPHGLADVDAALLVWLYVLTIATRYLEDGEPDAGRTAAVQLDAWLTDVLAAAQRSCPDQSTA